MKELDSDARLKRLNEKRDPKWKIATILKDHESRIQAGQKIFLESMAVSGIKGLDDLDFSFKFPVTAISGGNGAGKTTVLQLSGFGFTPTGTHSNYPHYVKDFFPITDADPDSIAFPAKLEYQYRNFEQARKVTLSLRAKRGRWDGHSKRTERPVVYLGLSFFIPKTEKQDISNKPKSEVRHQKRLDARIAEKASQILNIAYDSAYIDTVHLDGGGKGAGRDVEIVALNRAGTRYTENAMGLGEARVAYLVRAIEDAPQGAMILLEEPEIALHAQAQRNLMAYLLEVAYAKDIQFILTTHSREMLELLPHEALIYLERDRSGKVQMLPGISSYEAGTNLGYTTTGAPTLVVEDSVAQTMVLELLRQENQLDTARSLKVIKGGDKATIQRICKALVQAGVKDVAAVLDGDMRETANAGGDSSWSEFETSMFEGPNGFADIAVAYLPTKLAPEKDLFFDENVIDFFYREYRVAVDDCLAGVADHHSYAYVLGEECVFSADEAISKAAVAYWSGANDDLQLYGKKLVEFVKKLTA